MYPNIEELGMKVSFVGGVIFAVIGLGMAIWSRSQLVLLDGSYSLMDLFFTFLILKVTTKKLEKNSRSKKRFSKEHFIIFRSISIILFLAYLLRENIIIIMQGGKLVDAGSIGVYTIVSVLGGGIFIFLMDRYSKKSNSNILKLEKKGWLVDTMLSASIALSVVVSYLIKGSVIGFMSLYVEQIFVIIIVLLNFPYPVTVIKESVITIRNSGSNPEFV